MPEPPWTYKDRAGPKGRLERAVVSQYRDVGLAVQYVEQLVSCCVSFPWRHSRKCSNKEAALVERTELPESRLGFLMRGARGDCEYLKVLQRGAYILRRN